LPVLDEELVNCKVLPETVKPADTHKDVTVGWSLSESVHIICLTALEISKKTQNKN
jgi:hypothetical protein